MILYHCFSSGLSTMIIICVTPLFVYSSSVEDMNTLFLRPVFTFSLNVHFIFCKPSLSDISIFFILVEFHNVDDIIACMLTMLKLTLFKIYTAIFMMNKILKVLYIPIFIPLLEPVTAPIIPLKEGESHPVPSHQASIFGTNNKPMGYFTYIYLLYSGVLSVTFCFSLLLVMHVLFISMPYPSGHAH